jgi:serine/threonine protein kinase
MKTIGKFEIIEELGKGAMGTVYCARDPGLDRRVALKTVSPGLLNDKDALERFQREAKAAAKLQHPNIVTIHELGEAGGIHYIAMELLEGMDLAAAMTPPDRLSPPEKIRILIDICAGLDYAHKQGVFHRDVKPANIRLRPDGTVKILDFGIAHVVAESTMTRTGLVMGTPSYIAPEILKGQRGDHRADVWAVGVIMYEMLSGKRPYRGQTIASVVYRIVHEPLPPLDARALELPEALVEVANKALSKEPGSRFPDLEAMAQALARAAGVAAPRETPLPPAARERGYELNFAEARRLLAEDDLEGALEAARRAQALEPNRSGIVALVNTLEQRLSSAPTVRRPSPVAPPRPGPEAAPTLVSPAPPAPPDRPLPTPVLTELRMRGAAAFRELGTFGESQPTQTVCLSPVKDLLAVAGSDGAIRLWDLHSRTKVATLRTDLHKRTSHDSSALCLAFSPDGSVLASGHVDGSAHLWDVLAGEEVPVRLRHDDRVTALAFSPDGSTLATGSMDSNLRLWEVGSALDGEARRQLKPQPAGVTAVAYAAGGDWILTGHMNRLVRVLDATTGRLVASLRGPEGLVSLLCPSPDGRHVAVASHDRTVRLYDLDAKAQTAVLAGHRKPPTSLSYFADGKHLATVAQENVVQLWDLEGDAARAETARSPVAALWGAAEDSFTGLALFGSSDQIAAVLTDGRIKVWGPAN